MDTAHADGSTDIAEDARTSSCVCKGAAATGCSVYARSSDARRFAVSEVNDGGSSTSLYGLPVSPDVPGICTGIGETPIGVLCTVVYGFMLGH